MSTNVPTEKRREVERLNLHPAHARTVLETLEAYPALTVAKCVEMLKAFGGL